MCYPPSPESGIEPEDDESVENLKEVADSEATEDDEDDTEDVEGFTVKHRMRAADELIDTVESSPSDHQDDDADHAMLVDAAPKAPLALKRTTCIFADEEEMMFES
jgi:hypothetical protein